MLITSPSNQNLIFGIHQSLQNDVLNVLEICLGTPNFIRQQIETLKGSQILISQMENDFRTFDYNPRGVNYHNNRLDRKQYIKRHNITKLNVSL